MIRLDLLARLEKLCNQLYPLRGIDCLQKRQDCLNKRREWFRGWVKILEQRTEEQQVMKVEQLENNKLCEV